MGERENGGSFELRGYLYSLTSKSVQQQQQPMYSTYCKFLPTSRLRYTCARSARMSKATDLRWARRPRPAIGHRSVT